ncbi:L-serine ammonia-lyase [Gleimia coleocanis DSM 15436]|uniref:L-serine dehydratase n=1 Tax=Gleimia coleocanis DSM 15436 TaxID=525245 RepID=C0VY31_9ACTO|nr:L-serine ammonia-lyase [Gleimia coleocanis]EEH64334.1 L-serine ammonia-lyase [Gleimia coleocanis DSM 15436]
MDVNTPGSEVLIEATEGASAAGLIAGHVLAEEVARPLSVFDMFRIGIGPSSSHTVGPMRAGLAFVTSLLDEFGQQLDSGVAQISNLTVELFGSLGATGRGHSTDRAVLLGLEGYQPDTVPGPIVAGILERVLEEKTVCFPGGLQVAFDHATDMQFKPFAVLPYHVNGLTITARLALISEGGEVKLSDFARTYYSVGGGFVMEDRSVDPANPDVVALAAPAAAEAYTQPAPYPFANANQLLELCKEHDLTIADLVRANEVASRDEDEVDAYLDLIHQTMAECIEAGCHTEGVLPGGLLVSRRAAGLFKALGGRQGETVEEAVENPCGPGAWVGCENDPLRAMEFVNLYALAVNEENAAGHRVVTAPTNGAAGVIPAVIGYLVNFCPEGKADPVGSVRNFLLASTAIGAIIKTNASIAGAEVGCQGEVGSASAMAAAGLASALGGTPAQVENAAEIAMEHSLGLTCDPIGGLVQIPCIERNAIAAVKSINAARMALWGDGRHTVSLDAAIETMRQTGVDMHSKYKETSAGGLAVNVVEC